MVPPELRSTFEMLRRSFPVKPTRGGKEYMAVLFFLSSHLSERQLGVAVAAWMDCDIAEAQNDASKSRSTEQPTGGELRAVMAKLQAGGLAEWLSEDA